MNKYFTLIIPIIIVVLSCCNHLSSKGIDLSHWNVDTYNISLDSIPEDVSFVYP